MIAGASSRVDERSSGAGAEPLFQNRSLLLNRWTARRAGPTRSSKMTVKLKGRPYTCIPAF